MKGSLWEWTGEERSKEDFKKIKQCKEPTFTKHKGGRGQKKLPRMIQF